MFILRVSKFRYEVRVIGWDLNLRLILELGRWISILFRFFSYDGLDGGREKFWR